MSTLFEHIEDSTADVTVSPGVIANVKILGLVSRNNRRYSRDGVRKAVHLYEGAKVYVDHPMDARGQVDPARARKSDELLGKFSNVRMVGDSLIGDLHYLRTHPMGPRLAEAAAVMPDAFGFSHNCDYEGRPEKDGCLIVEAITKVRSIDLVPNPATTKSLFESSTGPACACKPTRPNYPQPRRNRVTEASMDDEMNMTASPDMGDLGGDLTDDGDIDKSADDHLSDGFEAALIAIIRDGSMSPEDKLAKLEQLINAHAELVGGDEPDVPDQVLDDVSDTIDGSDLPEDDRLAAESFVEAVRTRGRNGWVRSSGLVKAPARLTERVERVKRRALKAEFLRRLGVSRPRTYGVGGPPVHRASAVESVVAAAVDAKRDAERREFLRRLTGQNPAAGNIPERR